jgi:DNA-binding beta-propeller fold protein YncE
MGVGIYDAQTLEPRPVAPIVPPGGASALVSSPDGATVYVATFDGKIYGYDLATQQQTPGSGADASGGSGMPYLIGASLDGARVTLITGQALVDNQPVGANQVTVLNGYDLHPASGSPVPLPGGSFTFARGAVTGRYYVANEAGVLALDAASYRQVSGSPAAVPVPGLVAVSPDESVAFAVGIDAERKSFVLCRVDVATMRVDAQLPVGIGYFGLTEAFMGVALAALAFSADGSTLFFIGLDVVQLVQNGTFASKFLAFDAATLQELSWSPLRFGDFLPIDIAMSPDGSRLYVLTGEHLGQQDVTTALSAVDPVFA